MLNLFRPAKRQALFICGCGHSGTTLVANMFAANRDVFIPLVETEVFLNRREAKAKYQGLRREADLSRRPYLAEKTPRHVLHLKAIRKIAPGAKFLILVRDGRDVAASFIKRYGRPDEGIARWLEANEIVERERVSDDIHILRYEDLIENPREAMVRACEFAGIPFTEDMLNYHSEQRNWMGQTEIRRGSGANGEEHVALRNWQVNQPIFDGRGTWIGKLDTQHVAIFESGAARSLMETFGYL